MVQSGLCSLFDDGSDCWIACEVGLGTVAASGSDTVDGDVTQDDGMTCRFMSCQID